MLRSTEGENDACGEGSDSGDRRDHDSGTDAPPAAAAWHIEYGRRRLCERSLANLRGGGANTYGPRGAVRANPKVRLKSALIELLQLAIEIGGD